jgi:hypothetical protein
MSSTVGPVCHIPPANTPGDPQPQNMPGIPGPVSPPTGNNGQAAFNAAIAALLNAMRLLLLQLANQTGTKGQGGSISSPKSNNKARWTESNRVTTTVRVFQNNDKTSNNWVDVEQINSLTMKDSVTGSQWTWKR